MPKHHTDLKALAERDDATLATFAGPERPCVICGGTGQVADQPCYCPAGRAVLAEADRTWRD